MKRETLELMTFVEDVWRQSGQLVVGQIDFFEIGKSGKGIVGENVDSVVGQIEDLNGRRLLEVVAVQGRDDVVGQVHLGEEDLAAGATSGQANIADLEQVIVGQVEASEVVEAAEQAWRNGPKIIVCKDEILEGRKSLEAVHVDVHQD